MSFLSAQQTIIDRLKDAAPLFNGSVFACQDEDGVEYSPAPALAAFVFFIGTRVVDDVKAAGRVILTQEWAVVVRVKNAGDMRSASEKLEMAGQGIDQVLSALLAQQPNGAGSEIRLSSVGAPIYRGTFGLYPVFFSTSYKVK